MFLGQPDLRYPNKCSFIECYRRYAPQSDLYRVIYGV